MAENPANTEDVAARWRSLSTREMDTVDALLADAWAKAKAIVPDLESRLDGATLDSDLVVLVLCAAVIRAMRFAEELNDEQSYAPTTDQAIPVGTVYFTAEDLLYLRGTSAVVVAAVGSFPDALAWPDPAEWA